MAFRHDSSNMYSAFLSLPTEIRCEIYGYILTDPHAITISAGYTTVFGHRIQDRARKQDIPGLPLDLAPLVRHIRDASLLSAANTSEIPIGDGRTDDVTKCTDTLGMSAPLALLLTCRLVNDELTDYKRGRKQIKTARARLMNSDAVEEDTITEDDKEGLSLYVTYPYGVLVLKSMYPYLLKQARRVYISGYYTGSKSSPPSPTSFGFSDPDRLTPSNSFAVAESFGAPTSGRSFLNSSQMNIPHTRPPPTTTTNTTRPRLRLDPPRPSRTQSSFPAFSAATSTLAPAALGHLIRTLFPATQSQCTQLTARILYPGENSYGTVWADSDSPASHILRNVYGGKIDMKVKRGGCGTGLLLTARPKIDGRNVSTSWENWRVGRGREGVRDLDGFLIQEDGEKEKGVRRG
jgi:hypothetical protein